MSKEEIKILLVDDDACRAPCHARFFSARAYDGPQALKAVEEPNRRHRPDLQHARHGRQLRSVKELLNSIRMAYRDKVENAMVAVSLAEGGDLTPPRMSQRKDLLPSTL